MTLRFSLDNSGYKIIEIDDIKPSKALTDIYVIKLDQISVNENNACNIIM